MDYGMKAIKRTLGEMNDRFGFEAELVNTNRRNFMVIRINKVAEFLISYSSLVALSVNGKYAINENYTGKNKKGGYTACSPTTRKHFGEFMPGHWTSAESIIPFDGEAAKMPYIEELSQYFNISGRY